MMKRPSKAATEPLPPQPESVKWYTSTFGAFVNKAGVLVDADGVAVSFKTLKKDDKSKWAEVLDTTDMEPADLLKAIAFDPRFPINQRMIAANMAAPYFTAKKVPALSGESLKSPAQQAAEIMDAVRAMDASVAPVVSKKAKKQ